MLTKNITISPHPLAIFDSGVLDKDYRHHSFEKKNALPPSKEARSQPGPGLATGHAVIRPNPPDEKKFREGSHP
jgi:hypothetical protein